MIELRTGLPGNGKTLSVIQELAAMLKGWGKHGEEGRPIFVHNVKDLALPHAPLPVIEVEGKNGKKRIPDWANVPDGSFVIIDEAQDLFPPRSTQSEAPPHVAWLNTHRHRGVDMVVITQHPKLVDAGLRALVGKHKHYRRVFGMNRSICYEWDGCSDSLSGMKNAVTSYWSFPKEAYQWYKSAEIHTKQKFKLPLWLGIPVVGVLLGIFTVPKAYDVLKNGAQGKPVTTVKSPEVSRPAVPAQSAQAKGPALADGGPAIAGTQTEASAGQASQSLAAPPPPRYVGCISDAKRVWCMTGDGLVLADVEGGREASHTVGKLVPIAIGAQSRPEGQNIPHSTKEESSEARTAKDA